MERIDVMFAKLIAIENAVAALLIAAPHRERITEVFEQQESHLISQFLPTAVEEDFLDELRKGLDRFRNCLTA